MSYRVLVAALAAALLATGCGNTSTGGGGGGEVKGKVFRSTSVTEQGKPRALVEGTNVELRFTDDGRLLASAGCNQMQGPVSLDDGKIAPGGKYLIKLDVEGVEIEAMKGGVRLMQGDSVLLCEEHGNDPRHTVSRYILEQTPLKLIVYDPRSNRLETVTDLSILDRIKVSTHVGYNVFGTASAFWLARIDALNAKAGRRVQ